ncbi:SDR family NAD(P)-dependent oxidoreductase [Paraburkholderia susongensis]|uniref:NAD(P)-dependent dehydrogenase, short-chain alcohol dehydrogenase family n=1 Tax=Paraburkholderia susongensis TaxID=1515439 RepID=A0A1X7L8X6_9BURK|nr:SDR family NAD(P)-dependent oxidoreductase [Paraburkholderia susongensis]SMG49853.1 NAD(P)-dependent dehydrogenase, short-chain alcohol dehydrogenase family [Paraburkholderia susongensis]
MEKTIGGGAGRVAVVTGGAMGIGADTAEQLAKRGYHVVLADLNEQSAAETAARLSAENLSVSSVRMDVGSPESIATAFGSIAKQHGRCDVLVNGAGIAKLVPFIDYPLDTFLTTMQVNLVGTLLCAQHAARLMIEHRWGRIVNIASVAGMRAVGKGRTAYGTSKGAVIALTHQMAVELCDYGITANAVAPGPVDTPMTRALHSDQFREEYSRAIPMRRYGTTSEIAAAICYLASDEAAYTNGVVLPVDGGFLSWGAGAV